LGWFFSGGAFLRRLTRLLPCLFEGYDGLLQDPKPYVLAAVQQDPVAPNLRYLANEASSGQYLIAGLQVLEHLLAALPPLPALPD